MLYVVDAHALIWYLTNDAKLSVNARNALRRIDEGNDEGLIPTIVLAEILYASERGRISITLEFVLKELRRRKHYRIVSFTRTILTDVEKIKNVPELHDRLIVATAIRHKAIVITRDPDIVNSGIVKTIW
jgi:PIN domain nuclease of toxin-antitoxin system